MGRHLVTELGPAVIFFPENYDLPIHASQSTQYEILDGSKLDYIYLLLGTLSCLVQINSGGIKYIARLD